MPEKLHLFILGAGFSSNAGLPLADSFTKELLNLKGLKLDGPSSMMVEYLKDFVDETFGNGGTVEPNNWPVLEDIFTLVDLSANTGHHLGSQYSAGDLRTVRRALIVRLIRMLQQQYNRSRRKPNSSSRRLDEFFQRLDLESTAVLNLNWDCVVERGLTRTQKVTNYDYGCDARAAQFTKNNLDLIDKGEARKFRLLKPHGSFNWLYCDACREVYWLPPKQTERIAQTLFRTRDWNVVKQGTGKKSKVITRNPQCPLCGSKALGTRVATFSYQKALDFPMHEATWRKAETLLRRAESWTFFGYSMPGADFEFKHLLKRVELSRMEKPEVILVTGGTDAKRTEHMFRSFFGSDVNAEQNYYLCGLTDSVVARLEELGALNTD